jgi:hypothetical protein
VAWKEYVVCMGKFLVCIQIDLLLLYMANIYVKIYNFQQQKKKTSTPNLSYTVISPTKQQQQKKEIYI